MRIGVPREIKVHEYRVGLTPESVGALVARGQQVIVERDAGAGIGATDDVYREAGAAIAADAAEVFAQADLVVKVKEPQARERALLRRGQALFAYLHLAPDPAQARDLLERGVTAIAYETVTAAQGGLPLLAPMSEVAGRMAVQVAAHYLEKPHGGRGVLLAGATGGAPASVVILGAGGVGANAASIALAMGAEVTVISRSAHPLRSLGAKLPRLHPVLSDARSIERHVRDADVVIGAALVPGALAPRLVSRGQLASMRAGAVMVDVSIDQGGCFETSRPTTHADPVYSLGGIVHYCVANMPGAVPRTSTYALNRATLPFVEALAVQGVRGALASDPHLRDGLNVCNGRITRTEIAEALGCDWTPAEDALAGAGAP